MPKMGRPGIPYERFVEVWEALIKEGRAKTTIARDQLGGSNSTIAAFRERYEREYAAKARTIINSIELPDAVHQAIAKIKTKEIDALEKAQQQLESRIDGYIDGMKKAETTLAETQEKYRAAQSRFERDTLALERQLAASQARVTDLEKRERDLVAQRHTLNDQYNQAKQEAAVAKKEIDMLREAMPLKAKHK